MCRLKGKKLSYTLQVLCRAGFCSFPHRSDIAMQIDVNDGPKIGELPIDAFGQVWTRFGICRDMTGIES